MLKLSKTNDQVKRKKQFKINDQIVLDIDKKTIYIENLPLNIDR